ncbi:MAG: DUF2284 domain-containing protein [Geobacteraceae bacterium]|nr:DUF2284 domain-containing protein [Geobacteraceae bacterium]
MLDKQFFETLARNHGFPEFRWIFGKDVHVCQWVRFKCMFGCESFGHNACCPPAVPSVSVCRELFAEYGHILVLRISQKLAEPNDRKAWSRKKNLELLALEREAFLAGYHKAMLLFMDECRLCDECTGTRADCRKPSMARPCPEALAVDVFSTVRSAGFPLEVLAGYSQEMNRYAFLLVG